MTLTLYKTGETYELEPRPKASRVSFELPEGIRTRISSDNKVGIFRGNEAVVVVRIHPGDRVGLLVENNVREVYELKAV